MSRVILLVAGTRPELIKLLPIWRQLPTAQFVILYQQKDLLAAHSVELADAIRLPLRRKTGDLVELLAEEYAALQQLDWDTYGMVLVQGDTTTALAAAQAAFYRSVPVGHVEAGLRTSRADRPFPEEMNRRLITQLATYHFAPTERAAANVLRDRPEEGDRVFVTGQTGIDEFHRKRMTPPTARILQILEWAEERPIVLVTCHRRENDHFEELRAAVDALPASVAVVWPQHPAKRILRIEYLATESRYWAPALTHDEMAVLLDRAHLIVTDSGGLSEEACEAEKPCIILREETERPEVLDQGCLILAPRDAARLPAEVERLLTWSKKWSRCSRGRLGDGHAGETIAKMVTQLTCD